MTEDELEALIADVEAEIGPGWVDVVDWLREGDRAQLLAEAIALNNTPAAIAVLEQGAISFASDVHNGFVLAARTTARWLDSKVPDKVIAYDGTNTRAVRWAAENRFDLRGSFTTEQLDTIRGAIVEGVREGRNPLDAGTIQAVRDSIGLTDHQAQIVRNYRRKLEQGQYMDALAARLSSGQSDRTIRAAMEADRPLTRAQIDLAVERYRENWITYRAQTISRTEALRSVNQGTRELFEQAIERRQIERDQLVRQWMPGPDTEDAREQHRDPMLLEQRPAVGEPYVMPDGTRMMHPGDPAGGAEHTANCRCREVVRFVDSVEAEQRKRAIVYYAPTMH